MSMVGSGTIDPNEKLALKAIARGMMGTASWALESINRPWTDDVTNDADPCQFPLQGIWCENGHVVSVYFVVNGVVSPLLPEWGALSKLKYMKMNQAGWSGEMPESWGNITDLSVLILSSSGLTSLPHSIAKLGKH